MSSILLLYAITYCFNQKLLYKHDMLPRAVQTDLGRLKPSLHTQRAYVLNNKNLIRDLICAGVMVKEDNMSCVVY